MMKYEYLKGSENDFEGAPEWAYALVFAHSMHGHLKAFCGDGKYTYLAGSSGLEASGITKDGSLREFPGAILIAERRPITEPEWDGVGLPPVGCECEAMISNPTAVGRAWRKVKVVHVGTPGLKSEALVFDVETARPSWADEFRPLRTEEDKRHDAFVNSLHCDGSPLGEHKLFRETATALYNAIAAGKIPGVKLVD